MSNNHIVESMMEAMKAMGPEAARERLQELTQEAAKSVMELQVQRNPDEARVARQLLQNYRQQRAQVLGRKKASQRTKQDRLHLIAKIAKRVQGEEDE